MLVASKIDGGREFHRGMIQKSVGTRSICKWVPLAPQSGG